LFDPGRYRDLSRTANFEAIIRHATQTILGQIYRFPPSRDDMIRLRYAEGERLSKLAREYGLTPARIHQIVKRKK
jgi:hypothetical protein